MDYIGKPFSLTELKVKIKTILSNRRAFKEEQKRSMEKRILSALSSLSSPGDGNDAYHRLDAGLTRYGLSQRERELIMFLLDGKETKEIGAAMSISVNTVKKHIRNIYEKCGVQNRVELLNLFKKP
ncbi:MAG: helix-turn-helix transcriptional regulator [Spirochaetales bacterium]|nr:helix-turn-helix transcriptional regulator [Spirochaetales bacterium]